MKELVLLIEGEVKELVLLVEGEVKELVLLVEGEVKKLVLLVEGEVKELVLHLLEKGVSQNPPNWCLVMLSDNLQSFLQFLS